MTSQIVNSTYGNSTGWQVGRTLGWALHVSKSKPSAGVFTSLYFLWKPTVPYQSVTFNVTSEWLTNGISPSVNKTSQWQLVCVFRHAHPALRCGYKRRARANAQQLFASELSLPQISRVSAKQSALVLRRVSGGCCPVLTSPFRQSRCFLPWALQRF